MLSSLRRTFCGPNTKERAAIVADFTNTHTQQSDADFVAACNLPNGELDTFIALRTRSAIADLAGLPPNYILANQKLDEDLRWNPGWDSLDVVQLVILLEDHLDVRIYDSEYEHLPGLYFQSCAVVKFVQEVHTLVKPKLDAQERVNRMSVSLIVTKSVDRDYNDTGNLISAEDWNAFVESDATLAARTEPFQATSPDGSVIRMSAPPGQAEMTLDDGTRIPFLGYSRGQLSMRYHPEMEDSSNPVRQKVAEIARHFNALITSDAGDGFFEW